VLRLPPNEKQRPPAGYTGSAGEEPSRLQIEQWRLEEPNGNLTLRMPEGLIAIDVDAYVKNGVPQGGGDTLRRLEAECGPLPPTWCSTAREDDEISGKYFFRVIPGQKFYDQRPGIEIVQRHHRHAVVWPSYNPDAGSHYFWWTPDGYIAERVPRVDELPSLPQAWVERLSQPNRKKSTSRQRSRPATPRGPIALDTPLLRLLDHIGLGDPASQDAKNVFYPCPQHFERVHDNFSVNIFHGGFKCWSCDYRGALWRLVMDQKKLTPYEALVLIRSFGVDLDYRHREDRSETEDIRQHEPGPTRHGDLRALRECYADPPERALVNRGITLEDALLFGVQWWDERDAWVIPVHDPVGQLVGRQFKCGRSVWCETGTPLKQNVFNLHRRPLRGQVVVVESPLDCVKLNGWGIFAVATYGKGISDRQMQLLDNLDIVLCLDHDDAGVEATARFLAIRTVPCFCYSGLLAKDPGDMTEVEFRRGMERAK
jgi:hypothetical protein